MHRHLRLAQHFLEQSFRGVRLDRIRAAGGRPALALKRPIPQEGLPVHRDEAGEILPRDPPYRSRVADIHRAQSPGGHPADMPARLCDDRALSHASCLHRGGDPTGRAAVHAHVSFDKFRGADAPCAARREQKGGKARGHG